MRSQRPAQGEGTATGRASARHAPRMAGTEDGSSASRHAVRFIPAGAGNTSAGRVAPGLVPVHPRGRGEHWRRFRSSPRSCGSSPRARGTRTNFALVPVAIRFIPAGAGNTSPLAPRRPDRPVHPRGRGEHWSLRMRSALASGSSPRARGTPHHAVSNPVQRRFIPAGAGNTPDGVRPNRKPSVHPRGRGEHQNSSKMQYPEPGSSPRARGTRPQARIQALRCRFIPAGAGNTTHSRISRTSPTVHPRGRGEHGVAWMRRHSPGGSSPRARGTPVRCGQLLHQERFIPAGAGNTAHNRTRAIKLPVHPRGRGEHVLDRSFHHS